MKLRHTPMDKGTASNFASAGLFGIGLVLPPGPVREFVLSTGLFAFSGGITNSLAVKMLFDRVPGLVGSGVIPARFKEIRAKVKDLILTHFFEPGYLHSYLERSRGSIRLQDYVKAGGSGSVAGLVADQWDRLASPAVIGPIVDRQLEKLEESSIGGLLLMIGMDNVRPAVGQFVNGLITSMRGKVLEFAAGVESGSESGGKIEFDEDRIIADVRSAVERLLDDKLQQLDAPRVKKMMEDVIRRHLGWLVVWGNVLGGLLGLLAAALKP